MALEGEPTTGLQSTVPGGHEPSVTGIFASTVMHFGDRVALVAGSRSVTYRDLDLISDNFARALASRGVNRDDRVALLLPRSVEAIAVILAILKRGATYVPLDPSYPARANAEMLADARPVLAIGAQDLLAELPDTVTRALSIADIRDIAAHRSDAPLVPAADDADAAAYIMYTSGSTGRPKGVMVPHRGIVRLVRDPSYMTLGPDDVILHTGPLAFDASTWEIWSALLNGARLVIVADVVPSVQTLGELVHRHGVTALLLTTGLFHLVAEHDLSPFASVRQFVTGGDVLSPQHAARVTLQLPNCSVINAYGPTENTVITCAYTVPKGARGDGSVPIGTAIAGTTVYILDDHLRPMGDGEAGQLAAGGAGVALGYFGRDDLTAQAFVDNSIDGTGGKIYLTGDLARRRPDGLIEFLGRMDRQIKIAGKRVELDDIEIRLRSDARVQDACVVARVHDGQTLIGVYLKPKSWPVDAEFADAILSDFRRNVPAAMVPVEAKTLERFPLNPNGKVDRKALPAFVTATESTAAPHATSAPGQVRDTTSIITAIWSRILGRSIPSTSLNFFDLGGTSLAMVRMHADLTAHFGIPLSMTQLFAHPTIERLVALIEGRSQPAGGHLAAARVRGQQVLPPQPATSGHVDTPAFHRGAIAIVGMAGRLPGARSLGQFWSNLMAGKSAVTHFAPSELRDTFDDATRARPDFVAARPVLDDVDQFDAPFFGFTARDAALTDPQQRVFLECAWQALEDAGYDPKAERRSIGIYAGASYNTYFLNSILADRRSVEVFTSNFQVGSYQELLGALQEFVATRTAYKLDLRGPAVNVQSACSTSLLAVAQAVQSLQLHGCDMALAGGISISFPQERGYIYTEGGMVSVDGTCRPFDAAASGTIFGSGCGIVVLKRLEDAVRDRDHIYAVVRGVGVNNDGNDKIGFTAPSADGQAEAIASALANAGVSPDSIGLVEAHGTATPLGDPIEFSGLMAVYGDRPADAPRCILSSVKANVGHLDAAAGITGLIKAALALSHAEIPPQANYAMPNPALDLDQSPFRIVTQRTAWPRAQLPRRASVSSFGVGGTNVHAVLEEAPPTNARPVQAGDDDVVILPVSARSAAGAQTSALALAEHLSAPDAPDLADAAFTLIAGRRAFPYRLAVTASSRSDAIAQLRDAGAKPVSAINPALRPVMLFPGQGAQYHGMGQALVQHEPLYRDWIDRGLQLLEAPVASRLRPMLTEPASNDAAPAAINDTALAQPGLFIVEHALAQVLLAQGIKPAALAGHSVGEIVAAVVGGVMTYSNALRLVALRGQLMADQPRGSMLAVRAAEPSVQALIAELTSNGHTLDVAAVNAPQLVTVAGPTEAVAALQAVLTQRNIAFRGLHTSHAFHSAMMDPVVPALERAMQSIRLSPPQIPIVSTVTGRILTAAQATSPRYWAEHCRVPVRFADALTTLFSDAGAVGIEVGPGRALSTFAQQIRGPAKPHAILQTLPDYSERANALLVLRQAQALLWSLGLPIGLPHSPHAGRVSLPTTPFERKRYWIDPPARSVARASPPAAPDLPPPASVLSASPASPAAKTPMTDVTRAPTEALTQDILRILEDISGEAIPQDAYDASFLELGFDSLLLGQVAQRLQKTFGVKLTFRQLMSTYKSVSGLAQHLAPYAPAVAETPAAIPAAAPFALPAADAPLQVLSFPAVASPSPAVSVSAADPSGMVSLMRDQLNTMQQIIGQQLMALQGLGGQAVSPAPSVALQHAVAVPVPASSVVLEPRAAHTAPALTAPADDAEGEGRFKLYRAGGGRSQQALTVAQQALIDEIVARQNAKTPKSKARAQAARRTLADPRSASGFRAEWKEIVYPIVVERSLGAHLHDIDGNTYVDLVNGYGQTAFGHSPAFVTEALAHQLQSGFAIGPQTPLAAEVAELFCEMTGNERATFCVTGSEAVMAAMRLARAVTGRSKVVYFGGDYHGQFDEVLAKGLGSRAKAPGAQPIAPGIPRESVSNMVVLAYDKPESLAYIRDNGAEIAAVLVETVQSRHPGLLPVAFLKQLREITAANGTALVFDEVVTGFRVHPGGMQAVLGIRADLATYGKVVGGGMPVGVLAGKAQFMDALDGGDWRFGDDSVPEVAPTFFAGTFVRHPLVLAAVKATLLHMKAEGPALQEGLARRTDGLVAQLNAIAARRGIKTQFERYSSYFYASFAAEDPLASLLYPLMRLEGVHIQEGFTCFMTTAHTDADLERIVQAFERAVERLQSAGVLSNGAPVVDVAASIAQPTAAPAVSMLPDRIALTEPQQEIYLAAQLGDAASLAFNESVSITINGAVDADVLAASLNDIVARHDALRGRFGANGVEMEVVAQLSLAVPVLDYSGRADATAALAHLIDVDGRTAFDLAQGPLVRAHIVRMPRDTTILIFTAHHIVCDGWSINVILSELAEIYSSRRRGTTPDLAAPLPFRQFALDAVRNPPSPETDAYWAGMHRGATPFDLPSDRPRPTERTWRGASMSAQFELPVLQGLKKAGAQRGASLFNVLFASFQVLIGRLAQTGDVSLAVPMAGQADLDAQSFVGHCVNFMPVRAAFSHTQSFSEHLQSVNAVMESTYQHRDTTLGRIVRTMNLKRDIGRTPLTDVQFNLERVADGTTFDGASCTLAPNPKAAVNFDLFFNFIEGVDGLRLDIDYSTDLYDRSTIERWIGHLRVLFAGIVSNADQPIASLPLIDADARRWLVRDLNATSRDYGRTMLVHELFEAQAKKTPDAIAVVAGDTALSYADIDRSANRLAQHLRSRVPEAGARIGITVHRSTDMLISLLAVMKAGCAYVPLDPTHPPARLQQTLLAARVSALILNDANLAAVAPAGADVIDLNRDRGVIAALPATAPVALTPQQRADATAYVIFTSGSTGTPKGVAVGHRSVVNFLQSMAERPGLNARDALLSVTTVCFDIAGLELFLPLTVGGRVVIADREAVMDGFRLVDMIAKDRITVLQATPSLWRMLLEAGFRPRPGLKMLCGGEPLPRDLADLLTAGGGELWNLYGPTETTIWSSCERVGGGDITIGQPIANTSLHILDANDQLSPIGVTGELYIGGDGLAHGYFDRTDLTSAAFRIIPLDGGADVRLYRTGDLGRRMIDGRIKLIGRGDQQIKLRGYRIELEEIEAILRTAPAVSQCAVGVDRTDPTAPRLIGYVAAKPGHSLRASVLSQHVGGVLPDYMVPSNYLEIERLPMTGNGKLDRKALKTTGGKALRDDGGLAPAPARTSAEPATALAPVETHPKAGVEERIAAIWREVLQLPFVAADRPILHYGADSLHLFRIAVRLQNQGLRLQVRDLLRHPTVQQQASLANVTDDRPAADAALTPSLQTYRRGARRSGQPS